MWLMEACRSIDINRLHKTGCLGPGWSGVWQWTRDGERVAWINLRAEMDRVHLSYRWRVTGGEFQDVEETVRIVRAPCRFGGSRPYFICPGTVNGVACGRRVAKLHGSGRYFLCRHCYRLAHASQSEADGTGRYGVRIRLGNASAAIQAWPRFSRKSQRACGSGPMRGCANKLSRRKWWPTNSSRSELNDCWRGSTTGNENGDFGDERTQAQPAADAGGTSRSAQPKIMA